MRDVVTERDRQLRLGELNLEEASQERDREAALERARTSNRDFTQVYPKGWKRLQSLIRDNPQGARIYSFLAEHMDGDCGAVVVSQDVLAEALDVHERTIRRITKKLEDDGAIVRIKVGTGVYAYALDPSEVWRSWDDKKAHAAFTTKTLVRKADRENGQVRRKLKVMMGEPELPLAESGKTQR
jgi:DNA-binding transcriptional regulator YhcF (GntR family)